MPIEKSLKPDETIMLTDVFYSESYSGLQDETYNNIVFCKVLEHINNIHADMARFRLSRQIMKICPSNCQTLPDNDCHHHCPYCGGKLVAKKQPSDIFSFLDWYKKLKIIDNPIKHIEY